MAWSDDYRKESARRLNNAAWRLKAEHIETEYDYYDESGNHHQADIFKKDGKLYRVERMNEGIREPVEIRLVGTRTTVENIYEKVEPNLTEE